MSRDACDEWEAMTVARAVENQSRRPSIQVVVERRERRRTDNPRLFSCSPVLISQLTSTCVAVAYSTYFGFELHSCVEEREPSFKPDLNPGNSKWRKSHSLTLAEAGLFVISCFYPATCRDQRDHGSGSYFPTQFSQNPVLGQRSSARIACSAPPSVRLPNLLSPIQSWTQQPLAKASPCPRAAQTSHLGITWTQAIVVLSFVAFLYIAFISCLVIVTMVGLLTLLVGVSLCGACCDDGRVPAREGRVVRAKSLLATAPWVAGFIASHMTILFFYRLKTLYYLF